MCKFSPLATQNFSTFSGSLGGHTLQKTFVSVSFFIASALADLSTNTTTILFLRLSVKQKVCYLMDYLVRFYMNDLNFPQ